MGHRLESFRDWLHSSRGDWGEFARAMGRWSAPGFFYTIGFWLFVRTLATYATVGFRYSSVTRIIQEWLIFFTDGSGVDLGRLVESGTTLTFSLPMVFIYSLVFLYMGYRLTPKPQ